MKISFIFIAFLSISCANGLGLQKKLDKQWELYGQAREALVIQVQKTSLPPTERMISRATWEEIVTPKDEWAFSSKDIVELKKSQQQRIDEAFKKAQKDSLIDLAKIRQKNMTAPFCADFPKGGLLHIHESGTLDRETVAHLLNIQNPQLKIPELLKKFDDPNSGSILYDNEKTWLADRSGTNQFLSLSWTDQKAFRDFYILPPGKHTFPRFEAIFSFIQLLSSDFSTYEKILYDFAKRAATAKVIYVELREAVDPKFASLFKKIQTELGVLIRVNRAYFRTASVEDLDKQTQELLKTPQQPWVIGIDFLANEEGNSSLDKGQLLYGSVLQANLAGRSKLRRTMHSGEIGDVRNPRDSIIMGAERLGHAVKLADDPVTLEYAAKIKLPIEINLSSNLQLTEVKSIKTHPFLDYLRLGLPVSLSTDDEGIFDIDINKECTLAINETDITYAELKQMSINSIETSFASDKDKQILRRKLDLSLAEFETRWSK